MQLFLSYGMKRSCYCNGTQNKTNKAFVQKVGDSCIHIFDVVIILRIANPRKFQGKPIYIFLFSMGVKRYYIVFII